MHTASIVIRLWFECPHCYKSLDLFSETDCPETGGYDNLAWDMVKRWLDNQPPTSVSATCGHCKNPITIDTIEW